MKCGTGILTGWLSDIYGVVQRYASLPILIGIVNGIIPLVCFGSLSLVSLFYSIPLILLFMPSVYCEFEANCNPFCKIFSKVILFTVIGWLSVFNWTSRSTIHYSEKVNKQNCRAIIEVEVVDTSCVGPDFMWLGNPKMIYAEIHKMKFSKFDKWQNVDGKLLVKIKQVSPIKYGDILKIEGVFVEPVVGIYYGKSFLNYLTAKGVYKTFEANSASIIGNVDGFVKKVCEIRNSVMNHAVNNLNLHVRKIVAALFFGCKQGVDTSIKKDFLMSGALHAFAISGLHIGILSTLALIVLMLFPLRVRYTVLPVILMLYVVSVGLRVSAIRAFIMITIWALHRAFMYKTSSVNIIFFTASFVLVFSPFSLVDIGFQYSFITVFFLIVSWRYMKDWIAAFEEKNGWTPKFMQNDILRMITVFKRKCFGAVFFCIIAWAASCILMVMYNGFYVLTSILVNIVIIPLLMILFFAISIKIIMPAAISFIGVFLVETTVDLLLKICELGSNYSVVIYMGIIPLSMIYVYYLVLLRGVTSRSFYKCSALVVAGVILVFLFHNRLFDTPIKVVVFRSDSQPIFVIINNDTQKTSIINCGSISGIMEVVGYLKQRGVNSIDRLVIAGGTIDYYRGADYLCYKLNVRKLYIPNNSMRSKFAKSTLKRCSENGARIICVD